MTNIILNLFNYIQAFVIAGVEYMASFFVYMSSSYLFLFAAGLFVFAILKSVWNKLHGGFRRDDGFSYMMVSIFAILASYVVPF